MNYTTASIPPTKVEVFITACLRLQNFKSVTYKDNTYTLTFSERVRDIGKDYSKYKVLELKTNGEILQQRF